MLPAVTGCGQAVFLDLHACKWPFSACKNATTKELATCLSQTGITGVRGLCCTLTLQCCLPLLQLSTDGTECATLAGKRERPVGAGGRHRPLSLLVSRKPCWLSPTRQQQLQQATSQPQRLARQAWVVLRCPSCSHRRQTSCRRAALHRIL